jgi:hypothetical protein
MSVSPAIEELGRAAEAFAGIASTVGGSIGDAALQPADYQTYASVARRMIADRLDRESTLGPDLFQDVSWNMTLDIYVSMTDERRISDVAVTLASGVPVSTASRFVALLVANGDLIRQTDPRDGVRALISLSEARFASVTAYLARVAERWGLVLYDPPRFAAE